jgi:uncharacterized protein (TIGR03435 family)
MSVGHVWAAGPEFEVASVRPSPPITPELVQSGKYHRGMTTDAGRVDIGFTPLSTLIPLAFRVPENQVTGPDWMRTQNFDIQAKLPAGASEEQIPEMLQALLADRFKLVVHRENKEQSVYALVVAKGGLKIKPSATQADAPAAVAGADPNVPAPPRGEVVPMGGGPVRVTDEAGGRGGTLSGPRTGTVRATMGSDGNMRLDAPNMTFEGLADLLTALVRRPVLDMTGLKGPYQMVLEMPRGDANDARAAQAQAGGAGGAPTASDPAEGIPVFGAVEKLGLKLESRKLPVETIVIDHLEKAPTDN